MHQLRLFFTALQFYTRLPIPAWVGFSPDWLHHASRYLPVVGIVIGSFCAAAYALAASLWPPLVAAALSTIVGIYLTGAFHEDGFADVCDGLGGGMDREKALAIMRDSRVGAYGAIGVSLLLILKCAALSGMTTSAAVAALLFAHPLSRLAALALVWRLDYAREEGKAKPLAQQLSAVELGIAALTVVLVALCLVTAGWMRWQALLAAFVAIACATCWLARKFDQRLGGYTGDCLGAVQQVGEVVVYLTLLALAA